MAPLCDEEGLRELADLKDGWTDGARGITKQAIMAVRSFRNQFLKMHALPSAVPTAKGGIQLEWPGNYEIEFGPDGEQILD